jgi:hypothetical protein
MPDYHPTACRNCGQLIAQVEMVDRCEASGLPLLKLSSTGQWATVFASPLYGPRFDCARFKRKEPQSHDPVRLEQCATCDAWLPPNGIETVNPGAHAAYEAHYD